MNWNKNPPPGVNPQYSSFHYQNSGYQPENPRPAVPTDPYAHKPGRPGGGWDMEEEPVLRKTQMSNPQPVFRQEEKPQMVPSRAQEIPHYERKPQITVSEQPGVYEKQLVEEITTPGGVRPRPPDKDLHEFVNKCKYLPAEIIIPLLIFLLDNPQRSFKALCVLERLVNEYEIYAEVTFDHVDRIRSIQGNANTQKLVSSILSRYGSVAPQTVQNNIIDLF